MKQFIIEIGMCIQCPHYECREIPMGGDYDWCSKMNKEIHPRYNIPTWCPLIDVV